jgi:hypothetical protein
MAVTGTNTLYYEINCPHCGNQVSSGIGFQAGVIKRLKYKLGDKISWDGEVARPPQRPPNGDLKTIGYFNCDNLRCSTWQDCFPEVQEALITICGDTITQAEVINYKPEEQTFPILEPQGLT